MAPLNRDMPGQEIISHERAQRNATRAAAPEIKPSMMTGIRWAAAARITPTRPAISRPPTFASTSNGCCHLDDCARCLLDHVDFVRQLLIIDPGTTTSHQSNRHTCRQAIIALAAVVLPIPISPVATRSTPCASRASHDLDTTVLMPATPDHESSLVHATYWLSQATYDA